MKSLYISKQISDIRKSFKEPLGGKSVKIFDCWTFSLFEPCPVKGHLVTAFTKIQTSFTQCPISTHQSEKKEIKTLVRVQHVCFPLTNMHSLVKALSLLRFFSYGSAKWEDQTQTQHWIVSIVYDLK